MKKKLIVAAMSATMVAAGAMTAMAAEPALTYTFDNGDGLTLNGTSSIVANPDDESDNVLCVDTTAGGKNGNFADAGASVLANYDWSQGATVSLNVRPTANSSDWNYLFALGTTSTSWSYVDGTIGFITRHGDPYAAHFPGDGWVAGNTVNSDYAYFTKADNVNKWYRLTYVYGKDTISIYVDDVKAVEWTGVDLSAILSNIANGNTIRFGAGASGKDLENYGGYIDDVAIYNTALDAADVALIGDVFEEPKEEVNPSPDPDDTEGEDTTTNPSPDPDDTEGEDTTTNPSPDPDDTEGEDTTTAPETAEDVEVSVEVAEGETAEIDVTAYESLAGAEWVKVYQMVNGEKQLVGTFKVVNGKVEFPSEGAGTYVLEATTAPTTGEETTTAPTTGDDKNEETTTAKEATGTDQPKTGDSAPIAILAAIATLAGAGVVVSRKKRA